MIGAKTLSKSGRKEPPFCARAFFFLAQDSPLFANRLSMCLCFFRFCICCGVSGTLPHKVLSQSSQIEYTRALSACFKIAFRSGGRARWSTRSKSMCVWFVEGAISGPIRDVYPAKHTVRMISVVLWARFYTFLSECKSRLFLQGKCAFLTANGLFVVL